MPIIHTPKAVVLPAPSATYTPPKNINRIVIGLISIVHSSEEASL
jgi:hypothetical protein